MAAQPLHEGAIPLRKLRPVDMSSTESRTERRKDMDTGKSTSGKTGELIITRLIDAPRERVFEAFTDCDRFTRWWGPKGFTAPSCSMDVRAGGKYLSSMRSPDGHEFWSTGRYREVDAPEKLVLTDSFSDEKGNVVPASYYGMEGDWPLEMLVTVTFEEQDGKTKLTLRHAGVDRITDKDRDDMKQGWDESFDKLAQSLADH
jgi:uncharacterized protein YndB with AHSA1/START domain